MLILVLRNSRGLCLTGFIWGIVFLVKAFAGMNWHAVTNKNISDCVIHHLLRIYVFLLFQCSGD